MHGGGVERRKLLSGPVCLLGSSQREEKHETEFELEVALESCSSHFRGKQSETQKYEVTLIRKHGSDSQRIWRYFL